MFPYLKVATEPRTLVLVLHTDEDYNYCDHNGCRGRHTFIWFLVLRLTRNPVFFIRGWLCMDAI